MGAIILSIGHNGKVATIGCVFEMSELGSACFVCWVLINKTQPIWQYFSFFFVVCFVFPASNHKVKNFSSFLPYVRCFVLPTSSHSIPKEHNFVVKVVCFVFPTSDHNIIVNVIVPHQVVCLIPPTSNHDQFGACDVLCGLYVLFLLHQTTTFCGDIHFCFIEER